MEWPWFARINHTSASHIKLYRFFGSSLTIFSSERKVRSLSLLLLSYNVGSYVYEHDSPVRISSQDLWLLHSRRDASLSPRILRHVVESMIRSSKYGLPVSPWANLFSFQLYLLYRLRLVVFPSNETAESTFVGVQALHEGQEANQYQHEVGACVSRLISRLQ